MRRLLVLVSVAGLLWSACRVKGNENISAEESEFLSVVRYIITAHERKEFQRLTPTERPTFIENFWKQRDPDPATENNEFKQEFFARIETANHLFKEGSKSNGWLSDRGRVLIMLGAPERRDVYPTGYTFYKPPVEIWFYGNYPVFFVDRYYEGVYKLEPSSARNLSMIAAAEKALTPEGMQISAPALDFRVSLTTPQKDNPALQLHIPYRQLNLADATDGNGKQALLKITLDIRLADKQTAVSKETREFSVSIARETLDKLPAEHRLLWPLQLPKGSYHATIELINTVDNTRAVKKVNFKI